MRCARGGPVWGPSPGLSVDLDIETDDVGLPVREGVKAFRAVEDDTATADVPIVALAVDFYVVDDQHLVPQRLLFDHRAVVDVAGVWTERRTLQDLLELRPFHAIDNHPLRLIRTGAVEEHREGVNASQVGQVGEAGGIRTEGQVLDVGVPLALGVVHYHKLLAWFAGNVGQVLRIGTEDRHEGAQPGF